MAATRSRTLRLILAGDADSLNRTLQRAQARTKTFGGSVQKAAGVATKAFAGIAVGGAAMAVKLGADMLRTGDALDKMNRRTGLTVERIQELDFAAQQSGTTLEALEKGFLRSTRVVSDAQRGMKSAADTLAALGLTVEEVEATHPDQLFTRFADALTAVEDPTRRAALAQELFGRAGAELIPLLDAGSAGIEALAAQAQAAGNIMSADAARAAAQFNDSLNLLKQEAMAGVQQAFAALAPKLQEIIGAMKSGIEWARENSDTIKALALAVGGLITVLTAAKIATVAWNAALAVNPFVAITAAVIAIGILIFKFKDEILGGLIAAFQKVKETAAAVWGGIKRIFGAGADAAAKSVETMTARTADAMGNLRVAVASGWDAAAERAAEAARKMRARTVHEAEDMADLTGIAVRRMTVEVDTSMAELAAATHRQTEAARVNATDQLEGIHTAAVETWAATRDATAAAVRAMDNVLATAFGGMRRNVAGALHEIRNDVVREFTILNMFTGNAAGQLAGDTIAALDSMADEAGFAWKKLHIDGCGATKALSTCVTASTSSIGRSLGGVSTAAAGTAAAVAASTSATAAAVAEASASMADSLALPLEELDKLGKKAASTAAAAAAAPTPGGGLPPRGRVGVPGTLGIGNWHQLSRGLQEALLAAGGIRGLPTLASGGIVRRPTLAVVGEAGPEAVVPLTRGAGHAGSLTVVVELDGDQIARKTVATVNDALRRGDINVRADIT